MSQSLTLTRPPAVTVESNSSLLCLKPGQETGNRDPVWPRCSESVGDSDAAIRISQKCTSPDLRRRTKHRPEGA